MRNLARVLLAFGILWGPGAKAQVAVPSTDSCSDLKLEIGIPDDTVRPVSEVLLETSLLNLGHSPVFLSGSEADWWSYDFDVRDAKGNSVSRTADWSQALDRRPKVVTLNVTIPLPPGTPLTRILMLEKLFDLSAPGRYTVRISSACGNGRLTSKLIQFTVDAPMRHASAPKAAIAIHAGTTASQLPAGWALPLDIVVTNNGNRPVRWAMNDPPNTAPDESGLGVEVFDSDNKLVSASEHPYPDWSLGHFPYGKIEALVVPRGASAEQIIAIGNQFDIAKPGHYTARVVLLDPITNQRVESNQLPFDVVPVPDHMVSPPVPPFIVTLRSEPIRTSAGHLDDSSNHIDPSGVLICMSNISDHDIPLDNASSKDYVQIDGPDRKPAVKTEAAMKGWQFIDPKKVIAGQGNCCNWTVKPRKALCGGIYAEPIYDLSRPGAYRIRIDRYDEPDAAPGTKLVDLPIVHSNWLTFTEPNPIGTRASTAP